MRNGFARRSSRPGEERAVLQHTAGRATATGLGRRELLGHRGVRRVGQGGLEVGASGRPPAGPR